MPGAPSMPPVRTRGPREDYHYHCEGDYLTTDDAKLIGFLRDGFPVYGRKDMDGSCPGDLGR